MEFSFNSLIDEGILGPDGDKVPVRSSFANEVTAAVWTIGGELAFNDLANTLSNGFWNGGGTTELLSFGDWTGRSIEV